MNEASVNILRLANRSRYKKKSEVDYDITFPSGVRPAITQWKGNGYYRSLFFPRKLVIKVNSQKSSRLRAPLLNVAICYNEECPGGSKASPTLRALIGLAER